MLKAARGRGIAPQSLPRFCHESNRIDLIETDAAGVRTRGITRFQLTSIAIGAISNPSVSATEPCLFRSFPLAPLCRRLQVPHELMARGVYREQLVLLVDDAAVHRVIEDTFAR